MGVAVVTPGGSDCPGPRRCDLGDTTTSCTPQELRILRLAYASGRSTTEMARALGLPVQRIRDCIRQALQSMFSEAKS